MSSLNWVLCTGEGLSCTGQGAHVFPTEFTEGLPYIELRTSSLLRVVKVFPTIDKECIQQLFQPTATVQLPGHRGG